MANGCPNCYGFVTEGDVSVIGRVENLFDEQSGGVFFQSDLEL